MPDDAITVSFAPTPGELWRTRVFVGSRAPMRLAVVCVLTPAVVALVVTLISGADLAFGLVLFVIYVALILALTVIGYFIRYQAKSEVRQWRTMTFDDEGIRIAIAHQTTDAEWETFTRAYARKDGLVIMIGKSRRCLWIPNRAFKSSADEVFVRDLVQSKIISSPISGTAQRLAP